MSWQEALSSKLTCMCGVRSIWHAMKAGVGCRADPFAELEGLEHPSTTAPAQEAPALGSGLGFDALYGLDTSAVQQPQPQKSSSFLGGLDSFPAPAAQQPTVLADPFNAPSQRAGNSGDCCTALLIQCAGCPSNTRACAKQLYSLGLLRFQQQHHNAETGLPVLQQWPNVLSACIQDLAHLAD